jgi:hypothetical protein
MPLNLYNTPQVVTLVRPESGNASGNILMNYPVNRSYFKIVQGVTNNLEVFVRDVDHQISMLNTSATASISFSGTSGTDIPAGTIISTSDNTLFQTQTDYTVGTSSTVIIEAVNTGPLSYPQSTFVSLASPISGVYGPTLASAISGGNTATLSFNIIDRWSETILLQRTMTVIDITRSFYNVAITPSDVIDWAIGEYQYSVTVTNSDSSVIILYTDLDYSPYGNIALVPGPFPQAAPVLSMDPSTWNLLNYYQYSPLLIGSSQFGYPQGSQTFTFYLSNYTGTINIYGSLNQNPDPTNPADFFIVAQPYYVNQNGPQQLTVNGNYIWMQVQIPVFQSSLYPSMPNTTPPYVMGSITQVLYKN